MAAYAALTSLMQILDQLERHPSPPISLEEQQVESLTEIVTFLQEFLEGYDSPFVDSNEADPLEMRIADAAYAAEDVIESYIVDNIHFAAAAAHDDEVISSGGELNSEKEINSDDKDASSGHAGEAINISGEEISCVNLYKDLWKVIEEMDLIKKEVMEIMREKTAVQAHHQLQRNILRSSSFTGKNSSVMVGSDDVLLQLLDKLTRGPSRRQVIPITGMGGIGKTTLARNIFENALIKEYFDIYAWVTISQEYNTREILSEIFSQATGHKSEKRDKSEEELGDEIYKYLCGRRYIIIMDDIWSIEVWEKMKFFFPDCNSGSRIVVTTRQSYLTSQLADFNGGLDMEFLDEVNSWKLFSNTVFGKEIFPPQLEKIGKKTVKKCRGLPLSIVVIGGLLAKSEHTQKHWEHIEQKLNSILNSENDEYCRKILKLSYNHLPAYLKPSFLYMGIFEEDTSIHVSTLINLWICEGFINPKKGKSLKTIGKEFLMDLIDRNLILVDGLGSTGNIRYCKIHDLLRDMCSKEGEKERFYHVIWHDSSEGIHKHNRRRMVYRVRTSKKRVLDVLESTTTSHVRSFTSHSQCDSVGVLPNFRLLRILNTHLRYEIGFDHYSLEDVMDELVNSRYVAINITCLVDKLPSSVNFLWNLHTLHVDGGSLTIASVEIWNMSQLRHVDMHSDGFIYLPDPPSESSVVLENLETLKGVVNFKCREVVKRIPNIKRLLITYEELTDTGRHDSDDYCLSNLKCLHKLESFTMKVYNLGNGCRDLLHNITFPHSLKKLTLWSVVGWEEMLEKIDFVAHSLHTSGKQLKADSHASNSCDWAGVRV